jgi:hypothetical protein
MEHNLGNTPVQEERPGRMLIRRRRWSSYRRPYADRPAGRSHHMQATGDRRICVGSLRQPTVVEDK